MRGYPLTLCRVNMSGSTLERGDVLWQRQNRAGGRFRLRQKHLELELTESESNASRVIACIETPWMRCGRWGQAFHR